MNVWKQMVSITLILLLSITIIPNVGLAEALPLLQLQVSEEDLTVDDPFTLIVNLVDFENLSSFEVKLTYDPELLQPLVTEPTLGDIFDHLDSSDYVIAMDKVDDGTIHFASSIFQGAEAFTGSGTLISIPFKVVKSGTTSFDITNSIFVEMDKPGKAVEHATENIEITAKGKPSNPSNPSNPSTPSNPGNTSPSEEEPSNPCGDGIEDYKDYDAIASLEWAIDAIKHLTLLGIFQGDDDCNFRPLDNMTREEFATVLMRTLNLEKATAQELAYMDKNKITWSKDAVQTVTAGKLMKGKLIDKEIYFAPKDIITRAEIATILVRALHMDTMDETDSRQTPFTDITNHWAEKEIAIAYAEELIKGYNDTTFAPDEPARRAEVAVLLSRFLNHTAEAK